VKELENPIVKLKANELKKVSKEKDSALHSVIEIASGSSVNYLSVLLTCNANYFNEIRSTFGLIRYLDKEEKVVIRKFSNLDK